jgi:hypothetical protein
MRRPRLLTLAALSIVVAACGEAVTGIGSQPGAFTRRGDVAVAPPTDVRFIDCPSLIDDEAVEQDLDESGGVLGNGRNQLRIPSNAVSGQQRFRMRAPASPWLEIRLRAVGYEHYKFNKPVTVTIDYSRCAPEAIPDPTRLRVVYVDELTKAPLEDMGGVVDTAARTITFATEHFSSYVVSD